MRSRSAGPARAAAAALALLFGGCVALYGWQAWEHGTPIVFIDELLLAQISRAIAATGHPAWRGEPHSFNSLTTYLWAPAWWIDDTKSAYTVVKLIGVVVMTSALFPAYALARLVASRPAAVFAAAGTAALPALSYSPFLLEEPLAYTWATLSLFLTTKALLTRSRRWTAAAIVVAATGSLVRGELAVLLPIVVIAAILFVATSGRGRRTMSGWSAGDWAGAGILFLGVLIFVNAALSQGSQSWEIATRQYKNRIFDLALQAGAHLTIGLGLLPVVVGLALLLSFRDAATTERRAFACVAWAALIAFSTYTGIKAAFVSYTFSTLVEERNLIYVAPILFTATAIWLDRPRLRVAPALAAIAFVALLLTKPYQLGYPYFEAPGNGVLTLANRVWVWSEGYERTILFAILAFVALVVLLPALVSALRRRVDESLVAAARGMLAALAAVVVGWCLTGEISTANGFTQSGNQFVANLAHPLDWVDRATHRQPTVYFGQQIGDPDGVYLTEFWNRAITKVWTYDGSFTESGPTLTPDLLRPDGTLTQAPGTPYAVAEDRVVLQGRPLEQKGGLRLYRIDGRLRLVFSDLGVAGDGWIGGQAAWSQYRTTGGHAGTIVLTFQRTRACGNVPMGRAVVRVGDLVVGADRHPALGRIRTRLPLDLPACKTPVLRIPSGPPPFQVDVRITPTYELAKYGAPSDRRHVGAVVGYSFIPRS